MLGPVPTARRRPFTARALVAPPLIAGVLLVAALGCTSSDSIPETFTLELRFVGFDDDVGRRFEIRVRDFETGEEVFRDSLGAIPAADFTLEVEVPFDSPADVAFYADHDGDGSYDPPPVDHAWSWVLADTDRGAPPLSHAGTMQDIGWP